MRQGPGFRRRLRVRRKACGGEASDRQCGAGQRGTLVRFPNRRRARRNERGGGMKPPFPYFGGKTRLAGSIIDLLPPHEHYVEPFGGSLAVLLTKPRSRMETVNDLDGDLQTFWRVLRDQSSELARVCTLTPHSRAEYTAAFDRPSDLPDLERAR